MSVCSVLLSAVVTVDRRPARLALARHQREHQHRRPVHVQRRRRDVAEVGPRRLLLWVYVCPGTTLTRCWRWRTPSSSSSSRVYPCGACAGIGECRSPPPHHIPTRILWRPELTTRRATPPSTRRHALADPRRLCRGQARRQGHAGDGRGAVVLRHLRLRPRLQLRPQRTGPPRCLRVAACNCNSISPTGVFPGGLSASPHPRPAHGELGG